MTVTKQQQLEWLAKHMEKWIHNRPEAYLMSVDDIGFFFGLATTISPTEVIRGRYHTITQQEWQQERDKMQKQPAQPVQPAPDNSWHERGELPPVGVSVELWWGGSFAYNCEFITRRGHHYVMWNLDADRPDAADYMNSEFRPIRTEREKAIDELSNSVENAAFYCCGSISNSQIRVIAERLYDDGVKKVNP